MMIGILAHFFRRPMKKTYHRPKQAVKLITVWLFSIAMEYGPCIEDKHDDLPIQNGDFR
jgi:hypothetical protein